MEKIKLFNMWEFDEVKLTDPGLKNYINIKPVMVPHTSGRFGTVQIHKDKINIVERFMTKLMVPGHRGKKHKLTSGRCPASRDAIYNHVKKSFVLINKKTGENPVQILVNAVENSAQLEEIAAYRLGGIIARQAVVVSPQRRLALSLRYLTQGIYHRGFRNKKQLYETIAEELIAASNNDSKSHAIGERQRIEREAEGAR